jgi:hypothetical protein
MSQPRGFGLNGKSTYENVVKPSVVNLQFTVTPSNGLGVTSVKSNGYVRNVFMHTSTTPAANDGYTNPNPANGFALVQFNNNFNYYLNGMAQFIPPTTGSIKIDNSALTAGAAYVITTLGNASLAKWLSIGVPPGITPAVGVSFIATGTGGAGDVLTSRVSTPLTSGITGVEVVGTPNTMLSSSNIATNGGAWLLLQFLGGSFAGTELAAHSHGFLVKGGQAAATTNVIAAYAGPLIGKEAATDATFAGGSATNGGVQTATAGTPAGTMSLAAAAPTTGSVICMSFKYDASSVTVDGL